MEVNIIPRKWTNSEGRTIFVDKSADRVIQKLKRELNVYSKNKEKSENNRKTNFRHSNRKRK